MTGLGSKEYREGREPFLCLNSGASEGVDDCCWFEACTKDAIPGRVMLLLLLLKVGEPPKDGDDDDADEAMDEDEEL
jgi:hypothetical protein